MRKQKLEPLRDDVRELLREARVGLHRRAGRSAAIRSRCASAKPISQTGLAKLRELSQPLGGLLGATGQRSRRHRRMPAAASSGSRVTEPAIIERMRQVVEQSIEIIERRVNELGLVEPLIQRQGTDRILVQVPGLQDPHAAQGTDRQDRQARLPHGRQTMTPEQALQGRPPPESEIALRLAPRKARIPT